MPSPSYAGAQHYQTLVKAKTADYTLTADENGVLFTNRGASAAITFTLPITSTGLVSIGYRASFFGVSATGYTVTANPSDTMVTLNDAGADSITCTTTSKIIGARVDVMWDGTGWLTTQASVGNTYTVAT